MERTLGALPRFMVRAATCACANRHTLPHIPSALSLSLSLSLYRLARLASGTAQVPVGRY